MTATERETFNAWLQSERNWIDLLVANLGNEGAKMVLLKEMFLEDISLVQ